MKFVLEVPVTKNSNCLDNGSAPNRRQVTIGTNADLIHWRVGCVRLWVFSLTCQSQSGVPQIILSCYKALSQQKYKVWSHFPLKPHYNTSRHLMIWLESVRPTWILHRGSLKAEKIRNFSVMRLHLEKAPQITQFYNIHSINNDLLNTYKIPSLFLWFSCFLFHDEIFFCVKSTAQ